LYNIAIDLTPLKRLPKWYFDNFEKRCMPFYFGGCEGKKSFYKPPYRLLYIGTYINKFSLLGNGNKFDTEEECKKSCPSEFLQVQNCLEIIIYLFFLLKETF
jgi:Kunitz/Bovine pancreatic trypsin inhibitor domain